MKTALLLIDIQNEYFAAGKNPLEGSLEASIQARNLLGFFRNQSLPCLFIQHIATRPGKTTFLPGTDGILIHENIHPHEGEIVIQKHYPNSFRETALLATLRGLEIDHLVMGGMMTHMCVDTTVRAAFDLGFECWLAEDACATKILQFEGQSLPASQVQLAFLAAIHGTFARVMKTDQIIKELLI
jgi:nicotinamidase-related amidase